MARRKKALIRAILEPNFALQFKLNAAYHVRLKTLEWRQETSDRSRQTGDNLYFWAKFSVFHKTPEKIQYRGVLQEEEGGSFKKKTW